HLDAVQIILLEVSLKFLADYPDAVLKLFVDGLGRTGGTNELRIPAHLAAHLRWQRIEDGLKLPHSVEHSHAIDLSLRLAQNSRIVIVRPLPDLPLSRLILFVDGPFAF